LQGTATRFDAGIADAGAESTVFEQQKWLGGRFLGLHG
jgi:hypothetical protein